MTMPNDLHPHGERLAAYADRETDALRDRTLTEHLAACAQCRVVLDDLAALQSALAELPDLAPSRPLRLIPPVSAPASRRAAPAGWLRRLTSPLFAVGTGLVLMGAVGASGALNGVYEAASAGAPETNSSADLRASDAPPAVQATDNEYAGGSGAQEPYASSRGSTDAGASPSPPGKEADPVTAVPDSESRPAFPGFVVLLLVGIGLVAVAAIMRFTLQPRAGRVGPTRRPSAQLPHDHGDDEHRQEDEGD